MLSHAWGSRFDRLYTSLEVSDHIQDIEEPPTIDRGGNALARSEAKKDLPLLKIHLALSRRALRAVSV